MPTAGRSLIATLLYAQPRAAAWSIYGRTARSARMPLTMPTWAGCKSWSGLAWRRRPARRNGDWNPRRSRRFARSASAATSSSVCIGRWGSAARPSGPSLARLTFGRSSASAPTKRPCPRQRRDRPGCSHSPGAAARRERIAGMDPALPVGGARRRLATPGAPSATPRHPEPAPVRLRRVGRALDRGAGDRIAFALRFSWLRLAEGLGAAVESVFVRRTRRIERAEDVRVGEVAQRERDVVVEVAQQGPTWTTSRS